MHRRRLLLLLAALTAFAPMSLDLYLPAFPEIATTFGTDIGAVQLTLSACLVGLGLGQIMWGPIADRFGRKRPLYAGLTVFILASLLIPLSPSLTVMVVLRLIEAVGGAAGVVIARAIVRDLYSGKELARAMSAIVTVFGLAPIVAPLIGGAVLQIASWQVQFGVLATFGLLCLVAVWRMPETLEPERRSGHGFGDALRQYAEISANRQFRVAATIAALGSVALFSFISDSPAALIGYFGLSEGAYAATFAGISLLFVVGAQLNMRLLRRHGTTSLLRTAVMTQAVSAGLLIVAALIHAPIAVYLIPLAIAYMTVAGVNSNGQALSIDPFPRSAASAAALVGGLQMLMGAVAAAVLAAVHLSPPLEIAVAMAAASVTSTAILIVTRVGARTARAE